MADHSQLAVTDNMFYAPGSSGSDGNRAGAGVLRKLFRSGTEHLSPLRAFLLIGIFVATGYAFSVNFSKRLHELESKHTFKDENQSTSREDAQRIIQAAARIKDMFGVKVLSHIVTGTIQLPKLENDTIFLAVSPPRELQDRQKPAQALVALPPLVRNSISAQDTMLLEETLAQCSVNAPPDQCLLQALNRLFTLLKSK